MQPKTKTALANLLNNRLSSGPMSGSSTPETPGTPVMTTPPQAGAQGAVGGEQARQQPAGPAQNGESACDGPGTGGWWLFEGSAG